MSFQTFKCNFLALCKQAGLSESEIDARIDEALFSRVKEANPAWDAAKGGLSAIRDYSWPLATALYVGAPTIAGAGAGAFLSKLNDADAMDEEDAQRQETIDTYRQLAHEMELRAKSRAQVPTRSRSPLVR